MAAHLGLAHEQLFGYVDLQPIKDNGIFSKIMSEMKLPNEKTDKEIGQSLPLLCLLRRNPY
jgi:hypothetical protein